MIATEDISGLVLAGGRGSRMGGLDKGLQRFGDESLAAHALRRLAPQVGPLMLNANRNLETYAAMGVPVWPDGIAGHPGPLAGFLAGLAHCTTAYLATVPCDSPQFPADLVRRLAHALELDRAELAMAATRDGDDDNLRAQPVFCLMKRTLADDLARFVQGGGRKAGEWIARHRCIEVPFDDAQAFVNVNTLAELAQLEQLERQHG